MIIAGEFVKDTDIRRVQVILFKRLGFNHASWDQAGKIAVEAFTTMAKWAHKRRK